MVYLGSHPLYRCRANMGLDTSMYGAVDRLSHGPMIRFIPLLLLLLTSYTYPPFMGAKGQFTEYEEMASRIEALNVQASEMEDEVQQISSLAHKLMQFRVPEEDAYLWAMYFRYYGNQLGIDPILIAAVAYQESRFIRTAHNPNDPSWGLMQVMPYYWRYGFVTECGAEATAETLMDARISICYGAHILAHYKATYITQIHQITAYNNGSGRLNGYHIGVNYAYQLLSD